MTEKTRMTIYLRSNLPEKDLEKKNNQNQSLPKKKEVRILARPQKSTTPPEALDERFRFRDDDVGRDLLLELPLSVNPKEISCSSRIINVSIRHTFKNLQVQQPRHKQT